jgi:predicted dehydrogenase
MESSRRNFLKNTVLGTAAVSIGGVLPGFSSKSYASILGANERFNVGVMGVNSRGNALAKNFARQGKCEIVAICDVDSRAMVKTIDEVTQIQGNKPNAYGDFRKALEQKSIDIMVIATPDHWHAPAAILANKAGKHVYLEKPCSHSPAEGELAVAVSNKYDRLIQMGNQRRSWPNVQAAIQEIKNGTIGRTYFAKGWYTNNRGSMGIGKTVAVPEWLDYDLWQGPAPRREFKDNLIHYNWHWRWHWGTGEALNNGTHMIDLMRWGLDVDYPTRVTSAGGRFRFHDDWETPDTQVITLEFDNNTMIEWEGRSCNARHIEGNGVGVIFYGEKGSLVINGNAYIIYDLFNKVVKQVDNDMVIDARNTVDPSQMLDGYHIANLFDAISKGTPLNADILSGHKSTLMCQLGNIALRTGKTLNIDSANGHILNVPESRNYWSREYEPGWEPTI